MGHMDHIGEIWADTGRMKEGRGCHNHRTAQSLQLSHEGLRGLPFPPLQSACCQSSWMRPLGVVVVGMSF